MKKVIVLCLLVCVVSSMLFAESRVKPSTKEVTVYLNGAKVHSAAVVNVPAGKSEVIFEGLSPNIYAQSLQVKFGSTRVKLVSAKYQSRFIEAPREDAKIAKLQDSIVILGDLSLMLSDETFAYTKEMEMLNTVYNRAINATSDSQHTLTPFNLTDMKALPEEYQKRLLSIKKKLREIEFQQRGIAKKTQDLQNRIANLAPRNATTTGEVRLQVFAEAAQTLEITAIYLITTASWTPIYDISSEGTEKPVKLTYKGTVRQTSGVDWNDIKVKLSTANPFNNNSRPILNPLYINYVVAYGYGESERAYSLSAAGTTNMAQVADKSEDMEDVSVVTEILNPQQTQKVFVELDVPLLQTIPASGEDQIVEVATYEIPAVYQYHAVPKLASSVFLLAKITNYGQYNLITGSANIFYQNTLIGQSVIDPKTVADTMLLSFGVDENITIKRTNLVELTSVKVIGVNKKETHGFEIIVKNNRVVPISIEILDQLPIANNTEIEVTPEDLGGAEYTKEYGKLLWRLNLPANTSKKLRFSYTIKYPKDKKVGF